jgi:hypothetical protein
MSTTATDRVIDARRLATRGYSAMIESIAETQEKLVYIKLAREMFGDKALVPSSLLRGMKRTLSDAPETLKRYEESLQQNLATNYAQVEMLEAIFADEEDATMAAMAEFFAERAKQDRANSKKKGK